MEPQLVNTSIVALMNHPVPGTFTPQFFKKHGLFQGLPVANQVIVPVLTQYAFEGSLFFEALENRVKVELHNLNEGNQDEPSDELHIARLQELAIPLFQSIDYMAPSAVGINFHLRLGAPGMLQSFIPQLSDKFHLRQAVLRQQRDDRQLNLSFGVRDEPTGHDLVVEANVHVELPSDEPTLIIEAINSMPSALREVRSELAKISGQFG